MKENLLLQVFFNYLKSRKLLWIIQITTYFIFLIVFSLARINYNIVGYCFILSSFIQLIIYAIDFYFYYKKHLLLHQLQHSIAISLNQLPIAKDLHEEDYQTLVTTLYKINQNNIFKSDHKYQEVLDYYTLWAHQIKTPIAAMKLVIQSDEQDHSEIVMELLKIEQYVEMVLYYLRMQTMSSDLSLHTYSLETIVINAIKKQSQFFIRRKIQLDLQSFNTTVLTDEKWLSFVIEQLLSNALKYTPEQGTIRIYLLHPCTLVIEDSGIGIRQEDLPRVFEKGFTGYNGRMDKKSTGIGLYLCKQVMTNLGHQIEMKSNIHKGTKVFLNLETKNYVHE